MQTRTPPAVGLQNLGWGSKAPCLTPPQPGTPCPKSNLQISKHESGSKAPASPTLCPKPSKSEMRRGRRLLASPNSFMKNLVFRVGGYRLLAYPPLRSGLLVRIEARVTGSLPTLAFTLLGPRASWPCPNRGPRTVAPAPRPPSYPPSHPSRLRRRLGMDTGGGSVRGRLPACSLPA